MKSDALPFLSGFRMQAVLESSGGNKNKTFNEAVTRQDLISIYISLTVWTEFSFPFPVARDPMRRVFCHWGCHWRAWAYILTFWHFGLSRVIFPFCFDVFRMSNRFKQTNQVFCNTAIESAHADKEVATIKQVRSKDQQAWGSATLLVVFLWLVICQCFDVERV